LIEIATEKSGNAYYKELNDFNNWKQENDVSGVSEDFFKAKNSCSNFNSNFLYLLHFFDIQ
jgi:hypothetical protein